MYDCVSEIEVLSVACFPPSWEDIIRVFIDPRNGSLQAALDQYGE